MATKHAQVSRWRDELIPHIVDHLARTTPSAVYALYPNSPTTYADGYQNVTYKDLANAINGLAWWLHKNLGPSENFDVVAYIGPNDVRYTALLLGAIKAGYVAFFTSPRNSTAAHSALFDQLKCRTILTPYPAPPVIGSILSAHSLKHLSIPSVVDLLDDIYPHYPYDKSFKTARTDPLAVVHTSGSTGIPKALIWTHETMARHQKSSALEPPIGFRSQDRLHQGKRILNTFPPFHAACIAIHLIYSIPFGSISIAPLSGAIATAEGVVQALKTTPADTAFLVPSIVSDLSQSPALLEYCSRHLELILYAGGDLPQAIGDRVAAKMPIRCNYGSSEVGLIYQLLAPEMTHTDWRYVRPHPDLGLEFEEIVPGMFEMVVKRDPQFEEYQIPFTIRPSMQDLQVYRTRDLFVKHPKISDCWGWRARADDIIVFLNGEKTNPVSMEQHVTARNADVSAALVVGMQRFQAAILVEPVPKLGGLSTEAATAFLNAIWPSIQEANKVTPAHARVEKSMILLTSLKKPMIRSGKGTIQRQETVAQYVTEIDDLYERADTVLSGAERASIDIQNADQVSRFIKQAISKIEPGLLQEGEDNLFALGMDSLTAVRLVRALRHGFGDPYIEVSVLYNNPSVQLLTRHIVGADARGDVLGADHSQSELELFLGEYEQRLAQPSEKSQKIGKSSGEVVILTGSTGSLGSHLLEALLADPAIAHIFCLNRRVNAHEIHMAKAQANAFSLAQHSNRVSFVHAALHEENLGLDEGTYDLLRSTTTLIIHNAWSVNFMQPLKTFRSQFDGLINLFRFASSRTEPPRLLYISSISSVAQLSSSSASATIPEAVIHDSTASIALGYAQSKLLSELFCEMAAHRLDIPTSFARVGQIAGPVIGDTVAPWNKAEWLPSLVLTSISLGALPNNLGIELNKVDWMPVDILARALVEIGTNLNEGVAGAEVFNVLNPRYTSWEEVIPSIISCIEERSGKRLDVVPLAVWLRKLKDTAEDFTADSLHLVRTHPAIKLQEFYEARMLNGEHVVNWEIGRALERSKTLREMHAVGSEWTEKWVEGWVMEMKSWEK